MKKLRILLALLFVLVGTMGFAQKDTLHTKKLYPRPPIYGIPAKTLPHGHLIYRSYFTYSDFTSMYSSKQGQMVSLPSNMSFTTYAYTPKLRYGLTNRLTLIANFPLVYKVMRKDNLTKIGRGLGDIQTAMLYRFYFNKQKRFLISGLLYSKLPTGKATQITTGELPLGTGSYDVGVALMPEKEFGKLDMRLSAFYIYRSKNPAGVDLGDVQMVSLSTAYNWSRNFITEATVLYKYADNNRKAGQVLPGTYVKKAQLVLGAQYRLSRTFLLQAAVPVTLYAHAPFSSKYDLWIGFFYLW